MRDDEYGWVNEPSTYKTYYLNEEGEQAIRVFFNKRRDAVFRNPQKQDAFISILRGTLKAVSITTRKNDRYDEGRPKLKPGQRYDAPEINVAKVIVENVALQFEDVFGKPASGKEGSVFFQLVNQIFGQIELVRDDGRHVELGKDALKSMLPKRY